MGWFFESVTIIIMWIILSMGVGFACMCLASMLRDACYRIGRYFRDKQYSYMEERCEGCAHLYHDGLDYHPCCDVMNRGKICSPKKRGFFKKL